MAGPGVQANAAVAGKVLVDVQRGLQAASAEFLKAVVRGLPRAVPGTPDADGYVRKRTKRGGRAAKGMSVTVLSSGLETWMVDGAGFADQIHKKETPAEDVVLSKIVEATMKKAEQALVAQLDNIGPDDGMAKLAHDTAQGASGFIADANERLKPPPEWAGIMAGAGSRFGGRAP